MSAIYRKGTRYGNTSSIAQNVIYDNTDSNLAAENTQDAIDELNSNLSKVGNNYTLLAQFNSTDWVDKTLPDDLTLDDFNFLYLTIVSSANRTYSNLLVPMSLFTTLYTLELQSILAVECYTSDRNHGEIIYCSDNKIRGRVTGSAGFITKVYGIRSY